jgi:hypothetical protein
MREYTHAEVVARAGGRRRYNSLRQFNATLRRAQVLELAKERGLGRGARAQIARELNVHRSTITRDLHAVLYGRDRACPTCHTALPLKQWKQLAEVDGEGFDGDPRGEASDEVVARDAVENVLPDILSRLGYCADDQTILRAGDDVEDTGVEMDDLVGLVFRGGGDGEADDGGIDDPRAAQGKRQVDGDGEQTVSVAMEEVRERVTPRLAAAAFVI